LLTLLAQRLDGGTTVSGTMAVAHLAGIKIFSTGGIGGVHRGAETSEQTGWGQLALQEYLHRFEQASISRRI
jgi:cyanophycinase-like exopeptidase